MEQVNEKGVSAPPPAYNNDSDVESIIKPEKPAIQVNAIQENATKPLPVWQNNVLLRSKRRRLAFGGIVSILVILAIVLGVLASQNIIGKSKQEQQADNDGGCLKWVYKNVPGSPPNTNTVAPDSNNMWCAATTSGVIVTPAPFPGQQDATCLGWITNSTTAEVNKAYAEKKQLTWSCFDWKHNTPMTATATVGGSAATAAATPIISVYVAAGVMWSAGGWLSVVALIVSFLTAVVL